MDYLTRDGLVTLARSMAKDPAVTAPLQSRFPDSFYQSMVTEGYLYLIEKLPINLMRRLRQRAAFTAPPSTTFFELFQYVYATFAQGTVGKGTCLPVYPTIFATSVVTVTVLGNDFTITLPAGMTGTLGNFSTGLSASPTSLVAGPNTVTVTGAIGTFTISLSGGYYFTACSSDDICPGIDYNDLMRVIDITWDGYSCKLFKSDEEFGRAEKIALFKGTITDPHALISGRWFALSPVYASATSGILHYVQRPDLTGDYTCYIDGDCVYLVAMYAACKKLLLDDNKAYQGLWYDFQNDLAIQIKKFGAEKEQL